MDDIEVKKTSGKRTFFTYLFLLVAIGAAGFVVRQLFFCPECLASGQKEGVSGQALEEQLGQDGAPQVGSPAPNFTLEDIEGEWLSLTDFAGQNVLLVFWASNCGWCEKERPDLMRIAEEQRDKVVILAVSWEKKETLREYARIKQINFTLLSDPDWETQNKYLALGTPNHFLIDKKGKIAALRPGYASYEDLLMLVESMGGR